MTLRLRFINPNSTVSMTDKVAAAARAVAPADLVVEAATSAAGPAAIQGAADGEVALPGLLDEARRAIEDGVDVIAIACFDDTGIREVREIADRPVIGIGQSAFLQAVALGHRFGVVTTLAVSIPVIETNLHACGLAGACARVRASGVPVLDFERPGSGADDRLAAEMRAAIDEDDIGAIVLGCAGMADLAQRMERRFGLPVIDGVAAAVGVARLVARRTARP